MADSPVDTALAASASRACCNGYQTERNQKTCGCYSCLARIALASVPARNPDAIRTLNRDLMSSRSPDKLTEAELLRRARTALANAPASSLNIEEYDRWRTCWAIPQIEEIDAALAAGQPATENERT